jgi:hypothetical protein
MSASNNRARSDESGLSMDVFVRLPNAERRSVPLPAHAGLRHRIELELFAALPE